MKDVYNNVEKKREYNMVKGSAIVTIHNKECVEKQMQQRTHVNADFTKPKLTFLFETNPFKKKKTPNHQENPNLSTNCQASTLGLWFSTVLDSESTKMRWEGTEKDGEKQQV